MTDETPSTCREVFRRLDDYLDRSLTPTELAAVERHLADCLVCAQEFRFETRWIEELRGRLRRLELPRGLAGRAFGVFWFGNSPTVSRFFVA